VISCLNRIGGSAFVHGCIKLGRLFQIYRRLATVNANAAVVSRDAPRHLAFSVYEAVYAFARPGKLGRAAFSVDARSSLRNPIQKNKKTMADAIAGTIQMERQS
jgi:hypothetical protein